MMCPNCLQIKLPWKQTSINKPNICAIWMIDAVWVSQVWAKVARSILSFISNQFQSLNSPLFRSKVVFSMNDNDGVRKHRGLGGQRGCSGICLGNWIGDTTAYTTERPRRHQRRSDVVTPPAKKTGQQGRHTFIPRSIWNCSWISCHEREMVWRAYSQPKTISWMNW